MDPADAADGRRRTQAWMGPPLAPPAASPAQRSLIWVPNPPVPSPPAPAAAAWEVRAEPRAAGMIVGGRYQLVRPLGRGAITETWEARHVELGRPVAIKFLHASEHSHALGERLLDEARTMARIRHPHVAEVGDFGRDAAGQPFVVMELLVGETLEQVLARRGVVAWARAVSIVQQIAEALGAAHQQGVVHRDLQPANVFLLATGTGEFVKVVDFGLARATVVGGTPSYMSPEACRGEPLDPRSDVYAIGCLLVAMITGQPPFVGPPQTVLHRQQVEPPRPLRELVSRQFIPDELEAIVAGCLAKRPDQRFTDARALAGALAQLVQFSAAANLVGAPAIAAANGGGRPMGFAGRPAPQDAQELAERTKPAPARPASVPAAEAEPGMSAPAIVAVTLAGVVAVLGFGIGMYWLVERLIGDEPATERPAAAIHADPPAAASQEQAAVAPAPPARLSTSAAGPSAAGPAPGGNPGTGAGTDTGGQAPTAEPGHAAKPSKPASKPSKPASTEPPVSEPAEPTPQAKPQAKPKPTVEPNSKAQDQIGHEELLDPWG